MPRLTRIVFYSAIVLAAVWLGFWFIKWERPAYVKYKLKRLLRRIEPWTTSTNYTVGGWRHLAKTARAFQAADPRLAGEALAEHLRGWASRPEQLGSEQGKVFLLLRVVFALPESAPAAQRLSFAGWTRGQSDLNQDGTVNLAWPLSWNQGKPRLVAGCAGSAGAGYVVRDEYSYLRYHFRYRDLSGL